MKKHTEYLIVVVAVLVVFGIGIGVVAYSGLYNIGADEHHWPFTYRALQTVRDRSIHVRSAHIRVPNLEDPQLILKGAGQYSAMCTGCHLAPGVEDSEMREGMYPKPPNLARVHVAPQDAFWVIKHGIKMSAMPAWGESHDDPTIWSMVAFLERLPLLSPAQYEAIVAKAPPDEDMDMGDGHDGRHQKKDASAPAMPAMPGMQQGTKVADAHGLGVVRAIDTAQGTITLQQQAITSLGWPAMTMTFKVGSPEVLKGVKVGEKVQFTLHPAGMAGTVTAITPAHS